MWVYQADLQALADIMRQYAPSLDAATLGLVNAPRVAPKDDVNFDLTLVSICSPILLPDSSPTVSLVAALSTQT